MTRIEIIELLQVETTGSEQRVSFAFFYAALLQAHTLCSSSIFIFHWRMSLYTWEPVVEQCGFTGKNLLRSFWGKKDTKGDGRRLQLKCSSLSFWAQMYFFISFGKEKKEKFYKCVLSCRETEYKWDASCLPSPFRSLITNFIWQMLFFIQSCKETETNTHCLLFD